MTEKYSQFQYQAKTEAPPSALLPVQPFESAFHQSWSEPVRVKINKQLAIALIVSGLTFTFPQTFTEQVTESRWHQPWSEPVRVKPRLHAALNPYYFAEPLSLTNVATKIWHQPLSEPVRVKPRLHAALNPYYFAEPFSLTGVETKIEAKWHYAWSEPVRLSFRKSINTASQKAYFAPDRLLPTPQVTGTMNAAETNNDIFDAAVNVYTPIPGSNITSNVGIIEQAIGGKPASVDET